MTTAETPMHLSGLKTTLLDYLEDYAIEIAGSTVDEYTGSIGIFTEVVEPVAVVNAVFTGELDIQETFPVSETEIGTKAVAIFDAELEAWEPDLVDKDGYAILNPPALLKVDFEATVDMLASKVSELTPAYCKAIVQPAEAPPPDLNQLKLWDK